MLELTNKILSEIQLKDWFLLIVGMAIPLAIQMFSHINSLYHSWANTSNLLGKWNCYNWSRQNGKTIWAHEIWNISRSVWSGLRIDVNVEDKEAVRYRGRVTFESGHILFTVDGCRHQEHYQVRFADSVITQSTVLRGVFLASDYDRHIHGGAIIAAKTDFDEDEAKRILAESSEMSSTEFCVRVKE